MDKLKFRVSSALKTIIGRDLITDDFIAVFELVKNSYDAHATQVEIHFENDKIIIKDNGKGMDYNDLINKWLFVAYSAKSTGEEDFDLKKMEYKDFRDKIRPREHFAGARGIGRFSCDRLGSNLKLFTKKANPNSNLEYLEINWDNFEEDPKNEFINIDVDYQRNNEKNNLLIEHGTIVEITGLRSDWPRQKLLELKHSLEKLIDPIELNLTKNGSNKFKIFLLNKYEEQNDKKEDEQREKVNGEIKNFVFDELEIRTTYLKAEINGSGKIINTKLLDRGTLIYEIEEENNYPLLNNIKINLYWLNRSAKLKFKKIMGIHNVYFGTVFLYKNGIRIYPFGDHKEDSLGIDRRHGQRYARTLGTRDLIGKIEILGKQDGFIEVSSRDGGLKKTEEFNSLQEFFEDNCLKRLEQYVVDVTWKIQEDNLREDISLLKNYESQEIILKIINKLTEKENIKLLNYSKDIIEIVKAKISDKDGDSFSSLFIFAEKTGDQGALNDLINIQQKLKKEKKDKYQAVQKAIMLDEQKQIIESDFVKEKEKVGILERETEIQKKQIFFLDKSINKDIKSAISYFHDIAGFSVTITDIIDNFFRRNKLRNVGDNKDIDITLLKISKMTNKIYIASKFGEQANFQTGSNNKITGDIVDFIKDYVNQIYKSNSTKPKINFQDNHKSVNITFMPYEIAMIISNILDNSRKHDSSNTTFIFNQVEDNKIIIEIEDDGEGLSPLIVNPDIIFDFGFTTTNGSGIGLYHVKEIIEKMNWKIFVDKKYKNGFKLIIEMD